VLSVCLSKAWKNHFLLQNFQRILRKHVHIIQMKNLNERKTKKNSNTFWRAFKTLREREHWHLIVLNFKLCEGNSRLSALLLSMPFEILHWHKFLSKDCRFGSHWTDLVAQSSDCYRPSTVYHPSSKCDNHLKSFPCILEIFGPQNFEGVWSFLIFYIRFTSQFFFFWISGFQEFEKLLFNRFLQVYRLRSGI
jgi:hypothetical protein